MISKLVDATNIEAQYWGGFLAADGQLQQKIGPRGRLKYELGLCSVEREPIEKFKVFLGSDNIVREHTQRTRPNPDPKFNPIQGGKTLFSFGISATSINTELKTLFGIVPNKSNTYTPGVCQTAAFWRGFIDGDGWVCFPKPRLGIGGTIDMCGAFAAFVKSQGITEPLQLNAKRTRPDFYMIETTRRKILEPLLSALYAGSTDASRLSRKYLKAMNILSDTQL